MTTAIIITLCVLVLIAYVFDLTSAKTKIPSVILLLLLGWVLQQVVNYVGLQIPNLSAALPVLGTMGLILIVLEGSLELEFTKAKSPLIIKSFFMALLPMLLLAGGLVYVFQMLGSYNMQNNIINAIPICIISSAIAIPSVRQLTQLNKEFIIYESSLSDIIGVLLFNFFVLNSVYTAETFGHFFLEIFIMLIFSFLATAMLSFLLSKINHHVKFAPIILLVILIYAFSKIYHLPGLIFILLFGLFLGNLDKIKQYKWIEKFKPDELEKEVHKFKDITAEGAFLIRSLFFLLFGFLINTTELLNPDTLAWAACISIGIFALRALFLFVFKLPLAPLLYIAPRGLITILLFLSIEPQNSILQVNKSLIVQIIVLTALFMMLGLLFNKPPQASNTQV